MKHFREGFLVSFASVVCFLYEILYSIFLNVLKKSGLYGGGCG